MKSLTAFGAMAVAVGILAVGGLAAPQQARAASASAAAAAPSALDAQFEAIAAEEWAWRQKEIPSRASKPSTLPDVSAATQQRRLEYWTAVQRRLEAISPEQLSPNQRTNRSEEHTSELQSRETPVCRRLLAT